MNLLQLVKPLHRFNNYLAHEIIVVNDGSTDQTKQVAETAGAKSSPPYSKVMVQPLKQRGTYCNR